MVGVVDLAQPEDPDDSDLIDNPYILSETEAVGPNSFVDNR